MSQMISAQPKLEQSLLKPTLKKQLLSTCQYYCGCGIIYDSEVQFQMHVSLIHNGMFCEGSSHFISSLLQIVKKVPNWTKPYGLIQTNRLIKNQANPILSSLKQQYHKQQIKEQSVDQIILQNVKLGFFDQTLCKTQPNHSFTQKTKNSENLTIIQQSKDEPCEWNIFMLIPNEQSDHKGYYCGKCEKYLQSKRQYCFHVINECFGLNYSKSSHFLKLRQQKSQEFDNLNKSQKSYTEIRRIQTSSLKLDLDLDTQIRAVYRYSFPLNLLGIFELIKDHSRGKDETCFFVCGCKKIVKKIPSFIQHINNCHNKILPKNSSHIVLRAGSYVYNPYYLKIVIQPTQDMRQIWSCPCNPAIGMNKSAFLTHILELHRGISPYYRIIY